MGLPVNIPNITVFSNIGFATIFFFVFGKQKSFLFSYIYFVNLDIKKLQNGITEEKNPQGQKLSKLLLVEDTISNSYR